MKFLDRLYIDSMHFQTCDVFKIIFFEGNRFNVVRHKTSQIAAVAYTSCDDQIMHGFSEFECEFFKIVQLLDPHQKL